MDKKRPSLIIISIILFVAMQGCTATMEGLQKDFQSLTGSQDEQQQQYHDPYRNDYRGVRTSQETDFLSMIISSRDAQEIITKGAKKREYSFAFQGGTVFLKPLEDTYFSQVGRFIREAKRRVQIKYAKEKGVEKKVIIVRADARTQSWVKEDTE